jgi:hypothetical protein
MKTKAEETVEQKQESTKAIPQLTAEDKLAIRDLQHLITLSKQTTTTLDAQLATTAGEILKKYGAENMAIDDRTLQLVPKA